jgi:3-hydroxyisobutyrate dehydrogenase-like beta-hydroxyacid dehydrogenase
LPTTRNFNVTPPIAIIGAGAMGSMLARRAARHGCRVLTPLAGRTPATVERARRAGMTAASLDEILACPYILSIVPPAQARQVAEELAAALQGSGLEPSFVDCNALMSRLYAQLAADWDGDRTAVSDIRGFLQHRSAE